MPRAAVGAPAQLGSHRRWGDACLQRFGAGGLNGGQPVIEHRAGHFDELPISVGVLLQFGADLRQSRRQIPIFKMYKFLFDLTDGGNWLVDVHASG